MNSPDRPPIPVAYKDERFLDSDDARPLRILAEYIGPMHAFHRERICDTIVFFGSARLTPEGALGQYYDAARELARLVTVWSKNLPSHAHRYVVCTGGGGGIMEAANRGASEAGLSLGRACKQDRAGACPLGANRHRFSATQRAHAVQDGARSQIPRRVAASSDCDLRRC